MVVLYIHRPVIHPSKFLIPEVEDDGRGGGRGLMAAAAVYPNILTIRVFFKTLKDRNKMKTYKVNIYLNMKQEREIQLDNIKRKLKSKRQKIRNKTKSKRKRKKNHTWKNKWGLSSFPNFKPASNQTKIQKFLKIIFILKHIRKTRFFLKNKIETK